MIRDWGRGMDEFSPRVRYDNVTELGMLAHFREFGQCAAMNQTLYIFFADIGVVIPIRKDVYKTQPDRLTFILRSGSVGRALLEDAASSFADSDFETKVAFTKKRKMIQRVLIYVSINGALSAAVARSALERIARLLNADWPTSISIGYHQQVGASKDLPGDRIEVRSQAGDAGYRLGYAVGRFVGRLTKSS